VEKQKLCISAADYFSMNFDSTTMLSREGAIEVCSEASSRRLLVVCVEGGIWDDRQFEARLDCIWDGALAPSLQLDAERNNRAAAEFVLHAKSCNAFVITFRPHHYGGLPPINPP
jgi:hypothetical protein